MKGLYEEIQEIPERAAACLAANQGLQLPTGVPYIGMGSSYHAPLTLQFCNRPIQPFIASEYFYYLGDSRRLGVLISQSGESSETVWNLENFSKVISITDNPLSSLATAQNVKQTVQIHSGKEHFSATKSYVNTLITLYSGLGIDPAPAVHALQHRFMQMEALAKVDADKIVGYVTSRAIKGLYVIGSGPNYGTALEAALTLSETTKLAWVGLPVAQYDHGPKETADDTVIVLLNTYGKDRKRIELVIATLRAHSNALLLEINEPLPEPLSPIPLITRLNLMMNYIADGLEIENTFQVGSKVTTVSATVK